MTKSKKSENVAPVAPVAPLKTITLKNGDVISENTKLDFESLVAIDSEIKLFSNFYNGFEALSETIKDAENAVIVSLANADKAYIHQCYKDVVSYAYDIAKHHLDNKSYKNDLLKMSALRSLAVYLIVGRINGEIISNTKQSKKVMELFADKTDKTSKAIVQQCLVFNRIDAQLNNIVFRPLTNGTPLELTDGSMLTAEMLYVQAKSKDKPPANVPPADVPPANVPPADVPPADVPSSGNADIYNLLIHHVQKAQSAKDTESYNDVANDLISLFDKDALTKIFELVVNKTHGK